MKTQSTLFGWCMFAVLVAGAAFGTEVDVWPVRDRFHVTSLDGTWDFTLTRNEPTNEVNTVLKESGKIKVPGCWETQGFKMRQYGNEMEDLTGVYTRTFDYEKRWDGKRVILRFDGVLFGFKVKVNGVEVGGMEEKGSAFNMYQFDITEALNTGNDENVLEVAVRTRSHGWLFDTIDDWCFGGIFRSVEIFAVPETHVKDIVFRTEGINLAAKSAKISIGVEVAGACQVQVSLLDDAENHVFDAMGEVKNGVARFEGVVESPDLWTAETPNLYTLSVQLVDKDSNVLQRVTERVGIRTVSADEKHIYVNGKPILLRGVCWNEVDGAFGRSITPGLRREQMLKMKKANINYIRTAHYPFGKDFYRLADELGFYIVNEVPLARRGQDLLKDNSEEPECVARAERTVKRDRNHPSIIIWTVGNENYVYQNSLVSLEKVKELDPTRLTGLPQTPGAFSKWIYDRDNWRTDVVMGHYFREDRFKTADKAKKPFIQTEYAHSCAGGFSDFEYAWNRVRNTEHFAGGSIWLWQDQAMLTDSGDITPAMVRQRPLAPGNTKLADGGYLDTFGEYGTDGIIYADGTPKEAYYLVRRMYSPVQVTRNEDGSVVVENGHDFISLRGWSLEVNGESYQLCAEARTTETVKVSATVFCKVRVLDPKGHSIVETAFGSPSSLIPHPSSLSPLSLKGEDFLLRVGRKKSMLVDFANKKKKDIWGVPHILKPEILGERDEDGAKVYSLRWRRGNKPDAKQYFDGEVRVDGAQISYTLTPGPNNKGCIVECGLAFDLGTDRTAFSWIGEGPFTGVPGKSKMNAPGMWQLHKDDLRFDGNRRNVVEARVGDIVLRGDKLDVGVENMDGRIILSQNAFVDNYGNKFILFVKPNYWSDFTLKGTFSLGRDESLLPAPSIAPLRPFAETYGW
ncbi:MAG: hypothetical protein IJQ34_07250 [Kiritimatiellae bacterium]|nr:hypothetical protein [Kiritimatiellia bacterium]